MEQITLFWDFDGTLVEANRSFLESLTAAFRSLGSEPPEQALQGFLLSSCSWYSPEKTYEQRAGEAWWQDLLQKLRLFAAAQGLSAPRQDLVCSRFRQLVTAYPYRLLPDAREVLARLQERHYRQYLLSNNFPELKQTVQALGLSPYFDGILLSAELGAEKPSPRIFEKALSAAGNPRRAVMIGDNPRADVLGGKQAGMKTVLMGGNCREADLCLTSLGEVPRALTALLQD